MCYTHGVKEESTVVHCATGSAGLNGAIAGVVCVVVAGGHTVGTVLGVVVGRTSAASADNVDGDDDDQEQYGAGDYDHIESDADASVGLLCRSSGSQHHDARTRAGMVQVRQTDVPQYPPSGYVWSSIVSGSWV